ncbi:MAG: hypothetical protein KDK39_00730, partial [Leptospiraceae bacterium]|nr:hypothetical protein [Leptospiraceae bacterium]
MKHRMWITVTITLAAFGGLLIAQPRMVDRKTEKEDFESLQVTELKQEENIKQAYDNLGKLGWLVEMAKTDRKTKLEQEFDEKGRLDFKKTFRFIEYTPRNTYVRYVKETDKQSGDNILIGLGTLDEVNALIKDKNTKASAVGVKTKDISFQNREGIELTHFDFIYGADPDQRRAVGSRRKSLALYFDKKGSDPNDVNSWQLTMVVSKTVRDNFRKGIRDVELIVDSSPQDSTMDDVIILHRYNEKPTNAIV